MKRNSSHTARFISFILILAVFFLIHSEHCFAQQFVSLSDEQEISLRIDLIRKGIQQQDTLKLSSVFTSEIRIGGGKLGSSNNIISALKETFDNSSNRKICISSPVLPRDDSRLKSSNFWDFDILNPIIKINGDSAFVDCELILWGRKSDNNDGRIGYRKKERFVFASTRQATKNISGGIINPFIGLKRDDNKIWNLIEMDCLLDFLDNSLDHDKIGDKTLDSTTE